MSSTSSYRSPANGLNIPNDLGKAEVLCSAPRASTPRPGPSPVTRTPGPRGGLNPSLTPREPNPPKGAGGTEGRIFGKPTTSNGRAPRVASQQLTKESAAPKDVSSESQ
ncbi:hypothetical protein E4U35_004608 [Claviceps purpurea]|nr:hypothetical protein E4U35_004608 [Claviceps purpurea]